jgi:hypothetical protein
VLLEKKDNAEKKEFVKYLRGKCCCGPSTTGSSIQHPGLCARCSSSENLERVQTVRKRPNLEKRVFNSCVITCKKRADMMLNIPAD